MAAPINRVLLIATTLMAPAQLGMAQTQPQPSSEDNHWGSLSHQPTESEVQQREQAAGIARPQQQQKATTEDVEQMYKSLMKNTAPGSRPSQ